MAFSSSSLFPSFSLQWGEGTVQFRSVTQSCLTLCDPWTAACQASLSITNSWSLLKLKSIELVMPSNHLILCYPLLLSPSIFPSIRVFSNESVLHIGWPKYWSFSFSISPSNEYSGLISFRMDWLDLLAHFVQLWVWYHSFYRKCMTFLWAQQWLCSSQYISPIGPVYLSGFSRETDP